MADMNTNAYLYRQTLTYLKTSAPCQPLAQPWFVRVPERVDYPRYNCSIKPLICGEDVFERIAQDLENAQHSVDIITWGFDPGMVLIRGATAQDGMRYGDLLKKIATKDPNPVRVRLLVWHDDYASQQFMKANPGYYGLRFPSIECFFKDCYSEAHQAYNAEWYSQVCADNIPNIHFHIRDIPRKFVEKALAGETVPEGMAAAISKVYPAHHQKMVLVDYELPKRAKGYVMGHNSITDYWDTKEHKFRDKRRERLYKMNEVELDRKAWKQGQGFDYFNNQPTESQRRAKERAQQAYVDAHSYVGMPYQDVSCRVQGPILYDLNNNFCQAWQDSRRPSSLFRDLCWLLEFPSPFPRINPVEKIGDLFHDEMDSDFIKRRKALPLEAFNIPYGHHTLQLLRTHPQYGEKAIKECYANLTRQMAHYIFIQSQYIQYETWAEHLMRCVARLRGAGYKKPIYVFMQTSTPEITGMDLATYGVATRVGNSKSMPVEHEDAINKAKKKNGKSPITPEELAVFGINVFMGSLWTCSEKEGKLRPDDYEEIYIHTKVAIVDDAAFTIGSANLNLRSMALDTELNVLSEAKEVAYELRAALFSQCTPDSGPLQFGDMEATFKNWGDLATQNFNAKAAGNKLVGQLLPFYVNRKPGAPVI